MRNPSSSSPSAAASNGNTTNGSKTTPCCSKVGLKRGPWTPEEDELLSSYIKKEGEGRWRTLPKRAGLLRCGKSCRLRWMNYLRPSVKRGQIAPDEEDLILRLHRLLGNRWSLIAGRIPGRTDNEIKNYWNTHLSKKLISQGIDPRTHKPLTDEEQNATKASSSSKQKNKATNHSQNSNPNSASSGLQEEEVNKNEQNGIGGGDLHVSTTSELETGFVQLAGGHIQNGFIHTNLPSSEEDMNYCNEDIVFSSFLNSLINDDGFAGSNHQHHPQQNSEPDLIPNPISVLGLGWESAIMSSTFSNLEPKRTSNDQSQQL